MKRLNSYFYTYGKFGKGYREIVDTDNKYLYSRGKYPTKITANDLTEDYIKINSRVIWYMDGYVKTSGIKDIDYSYVKENHLFKDDYIYISYNEPLKHEINSFGYDDIVNYDICVCGNDVVDLVLAAEKYSSIDTSKVRKKIKEKVTWIKSNEPEQYNYPVDKDCDVFDTWIKMGFIEDRLLPPKYKNLVHKYYSYEKLHTEKLLIKTNKIMCKRCGDVIENNIYNGYKTCSCGSCSIFGGKFELIRYGLLDDYEELSELVKID